MYYPMLFALPGFFEILLIATCGLLPGAACALVAHQLAGYKRRSRPFWVILCLLFNLIPLFVLALLPELPETPRGFPVEPMDTDSPSS